MISMQSICEWAGSNPSQRKFVEGERVYQAGHIIKCGKKPSEKSHDTVSFIAVCLQTSNLKGNPHEINGQVSTNGKIMQCSCSCKAGLGEQCKHVIAALLYIYQKGDKLEDLSCTDTKCQWKQVHTKALENYNAAPLMQHSCFAISVDREKIISASIIKQSIEKSEEKLEEKTDESDGDEPNEGFSNVTVKSPTKKKRKPPSEVEVSESQLDEIKSLIVNKLPKCALTKHTLGRHDTIVVKEKSKVTQIEKDVIKSILEAQDSELMRAIQKFPVNTLQNCCSRTLDQLSENLQVVCEKTKDSYAHWMQERPCRITGSICYGLYTYTKKKRSDSEWDNKCKNTFSPKDFKTESTEHGNLSESAARNAFKKNIRDNNLRVIEVGFIVSRLNPWLGYSPDGIIVKDNKPIALLEIKCPLKGKTEGINETVASQIKKCLIQEGENIIMKEKHAYYGQIQLGMAVLNLNTTYFVIYSAFDQKFFSLRVARNDEFLMTMLKALKKVYFSFRLHNVCIEKGNCDTTDRTETVEVL